MVAGLFAYATVLFTENEGRLQRIVNEFDKVCERRKLGVNTGKSMCMAFERATEQTIDLSKPYKVRAESTMLCKI